MEKEKSIEEPVTLKVSPEIRKQLKTLASADGRGLTDFANEVIKKGLSSPVPVPVPKVRSLRTKADGSNNISGIAKELSAQEGEFLRECLRIYRSDFGKPLQENVTFFGIGLAAVEHIAALGKGDEKPGPRNAEALSPGEQRALAIADHAENENHLLKAATHDVIEKLRRTRSRNPKAAG